MDWKKLADEVAAVAKTAAAFIPQAATVEAGIAIGQRLIGVIDTISHHAPAGATQDELRASRKVLADAVTAKANATADGLEGKG